MRSILFALSAGTPRQILLCGVALVGMCIPSECFAQSLFGGGTTGGAGGGGRSGGSSNTGMSSSGGNSSLFGGGSGTSGRTSGTSTNRSGNSGLGTGNTAGMQPTFNAGDGTLGNSISTSGFVGRTTGGNSFVGNASSSQQRVVGGAQQFSQLQGIANQNNRNSSNNLNTTRRLMRPQIQIGFEHPLHIDSGNAQTMHAQLLDLPVIGSRAAGIVPQIGENGVVTLTGSVASEDDRRLMEILTRMEPGVRDVKNELQVVAP